MLAKSSTANPPPADPEPASVASCSTCLNRLPRGTCAKPVAAGLLPTFGIVWPEPGFGEKCPAYRLATAAVTSGAQPIDTQLTAAQGDACHAGGWSDVEIERLNVRTLMFGRHGLKPEIAERIAKRLVLRDRQGDDRRMCLECRYLETSGRCAQARAGRLPGASRQLEPVPVILQRCPAFQPWTGEAREARQLNRIGEVP